MRIVAVPALVVTIALGASACGESRRSSPERNVGVSHKLSAETNASAGAMAHLHFPSGVPASLVSYIRKGRLLTADGTVSSIAVYGPGSRTDLVKASSGEIVRESAKEKTMRFYLIVLDGHFVCGGCSSPAGGKPPHGTVVTDVWSAQEGGTDFGFGKSAGPGVARLHLLATMTVS